MEQEINKKLYELVNQTEIELLGHHCEGCAGKNNQDLCIQLWKCAGENRDKVWKLKTQNK